MSFSGINTPEYKCVQRLVPELTSAVQNDLVEISNQLLKHGVITTGNHNEFTDPRLASSHVRASSLIRTVLNRIEIDTSYFEKFVQVLEENELYYKPVLDKLRVDLVVTDEQPTATQDPFSDSEPSDNESSALLRPRPQTQYELHYEAIRRRNRARAEIIIRICLLTWLLICFIIICITLFHYVYIVVYILLYGGLKCYKIFFLFICGLYLICFCVMSTLVSLTEISYIKKTGLIVVMVILIYFLFKFAFLCFCGIHLW